MTRDALGAELRALSSPPENPEVAEDSTAVEEQLVIAVEKPLCISGGWTMTRDGDASNAKVFIYLRIPAVDPLSNPCG